MATVSAGATGNSVIDVPDKIGIDKPMTTSKPTETISGSSMAQPLDPKNDYKENPILDINDNTKQGSLNFSPNGRVQAIDGQGNKYDFNQKEYKAVIGEGGLMTPQVQAYLKNQKYQAEAGEKARDILKQQRTKKTEELFNQQINNTQGLDQVGNLTPLQEENKNATSWMGKEGLANIGLNAGAIASGAGAGATTGALVGGPIGAIAGGIIGGGSAFLGKLTIEARQDVKATKANFDNAKMSLNKLPDVLVTNPELRDQVIKQWNDNLMIIRESERTLRAQNTNLIGKKLADNLDELSDIEQFYRDYALLYDTPFKQKLMMSA